MQNFHPLFVHFPLALLIAAFFLELVSDLTRRDKLRSAATYNLALGTAAAWAAVATGWWAGESVPHPDAAREIIERHELFAFITAGISTLLLAWHRSYSIRGGIWIKWVLYAALLVMLAATGWFGGKLVYEYGVGGVYGG